MLTTEKKKRYILNHSNEHIQEIINSQRKKIEADDNAVRINELFNMVLMWEREFNLMQQHSEVESKEHIIDMLENITDEEQEVIQEL